MEFPRPVTKKDVKSYLGLCGYYRRFIANFSDIAEPLTLLTKKAAPIVVFWTPECEEAFKALRLMLTSSPVLIPPDYSLPFVVQTDASDVGLGVVLSQVVDEVEHPVCFLSTKLLPCERNYSTIEKECLAIVWGIQMLDPYLFGRMFTVQTDHNPIQWLNSLKAKSQRLLRWSLMLQEYRFNIIHRKGVLNANADSLSRVSE